MSGDALQPWELLPSDTGKSFESFVLYRDMGLARSLAAVAKMPGTPTLRQLQKLSSNHQWAARVAAYDRHLDAIRVKDREQAARESADRDIAIANALKNQLVLRIQDGLDSAKVTVETAARTLRTLQEVTSKAYGDVVRVDVTSGGQPLNDAEREQFVSLVINVLVAHPEALDAVMKALLEDE